MVGIIQSSPHPLGASAVNLLDPLRPLGLLLLLLFLLGSSGLSACTDDQGMVTPEDTEEWTYVSWEAREQRAAEYLAHVEAMAGQEFPLSLGFPDCPDDADCVDGVLVGDLFYARWGLPVPEELVGPTVARADQMEVRAIDGLDPVHYLAFMEPEGPMLLGLSEFPWEPTTRELAVEVRERRCALPDLIPDQEVVGAEECDGLFHSWFTTDWSPPWLDDPTLRLVDPTERHREPTPDHLRSVEAQVAAGADPDDLAVVDQWGNDVGRPYLDPVEALAAHLDQGCAPDAGAPCRAGFRLEHQSEARVSAIFSYQARRSDTEDEVAVTFSRLTLTRLGGATWWITTVGPTGAYDTYDTSTSAAEANRLFADCCSTEIEHSW